MVRQVPSNMGLPNGLPFQAPVRRQRLEAALSTGSTLLPLRHPEAHGHGRGAQTTVRSNYLK